MAFVSYGSPSTRYGLWAGRRIVAVDDIETPDLQAFVEAVKGKEDQASVRLKTVTWNGAVEVGPARSLNDRPLTHRPFPPS